MRWPRADKKRVAKKRAAKKWMLLWIALALTLLWQWAAVTAQKTSQTADQIPAAGEPAGATPSLQRDFARFFQKGSANASDALTHPPSTQSFVTGDYRFVVTATDQWQTADVTGQLYQEDSQGVRLLWEASLPQQYGPRFVVVGAQGQVLLVDEFINVASPYALMLIDATGEPVATYTFEDIQQVLSVSAAELTQQATNGWWVSAAPRLTAQPKDASLPRTPADDSLHQTVLISTGGSRIAVDLLTGELTSHPNLQDL